ncbi:squalene synthase HpnC [Thermopirellula anaerolimosa]
MPPTTSAPGASRWDRDEAAQFAADLERFGPHSNGPTVSLRNARQYCRRLTRTHYENFTVAGLLLPRRLRQHFCNVYAWCRWADDLSDEISRTDVARELLDWWRSELQACYQGRPRHPVTVALQETVREFQIPITPFLDLLSAFRQDQEVSRYETMESLLNYCRYSANPVGHLVLYMGRCHTPAHVRYADSVCTGLQLANFWQDVAEDYRRGRIYIPLSARLRAGYDDTMLQRGEFNPAFRRMMEGLTAEAAAFLRSGEPLVRMMPRDMRIPVLLFILGGLAILDAVKAVDYDVWHRRPQLSRRNKAALVVRACWSVWSGRSSEVPA